MTKSSFQDCLPQLRVSDIGELPVYVSMTISVDTSYHILFIITNIIDLYCCFLYVDVILTDLSLPVLFITEFR
jgi:hypothetical protein